MLGGVANAEKEENQEKEKEKKITSVWAKIVEGWRKLLLPTSKETETKRKRNIDRLKSKLLEEELKTKISNTKAKRRKAEEKKLPSFLEPTGYNNNPPNFLR